MIMMLYICRYFTVYDDNSDDGDDTSYSDDELN